MEKTKKKDFIEIEYTGYSNGNIFDSNIPDDLKKLNPKAKQEKTIVIIGEKNVVPGLDKALEEKEIGKEYEISLEPKDAFGLRDKNLMKTIPLKVFTAQKINPYPGAVLNMDGAIAKIISVSGARVMTDFNNPLAGKPVKYKFKIVKILTDDKEKVTSYFQNTFHFVPEFDVSKEEIIIKGPKPLEQFLMQLKDKIKSLFDKDIKFIEKASEENKNKEENKDIKEKVEEVVEAKVEEMREKSNSS
jgi:FKBP-type peptidyl-prolyl cis-trans isomerase 2